MNPIDFPHRNKILTAPAKMTTQECGDLFVCSFRGEITSCWYLTFFERIKLLFTGVIWLTILSGDTSPPVKVEVKNPWK